MQRRGTLRWIRGLKYWCLFRIQNKLLTRISQSMKRSGWKMYVCLGLLLVIVKYSHRYFWSAVALLCYVQADTRRWIFQQRSDLACHTEHAALVSQVCRYLAARIWGGMKKKKKKKTAWCKWVKATLKCFCLSDALDTESGAVDQPLGCLNTLPGLRHLVA